MADKGTIGYLMSKQSYKDFAIRAEFRAATDTNSGIFIRLTDPAKITTDNAHEVNAWDIRPDPKFGTGHTAIVLGASGSVGAALLAELERSDRFARVIVLVRRPLGAGSAAHPKVIERRVPDMQPVALQQAVVDALRDGGADAVDSSAVGFSVLGVGAGTAKMSLAEHRAIDVELNAAFARGLKASGKVRHLAFMSAIGADIHARTTGSGAAGMPRYARVKGEAEQAVLRDGPEVVTVFRPSVIIGSRHTPGFLAGALSTLAPLIPARYRPIRTTDIARAMVAAALADPRSRATLDYAGMKALVAGAG